MADQIRSIFCQGINLTGATTWSVTDQAGPRTVTFNPGGTPLWYRTITYTSQTGTEARPIDFLKHVKTQLNAGAGGAVYGTSIDTSGFVNITYTGTGTSTITAIDGSVAPCLGITGTFAIPTGTIYVPTYHPTHIIYAQGRTDDTDWIPRADTIVGSENEDGTVDTLRSGVTGAERQFTFFAHPRNWTIRLARGAAGSPFYSDESQWLSTHLDTPTIAPPWSLQRFMHSGVGRRIAACFDFQSVVTGGHPTLYDTTIGLESAKQKDPARPTRPYFEELLDWRNVRLRFVGVIT